MTKKLIVSGIDITHSRLVELTKLADQAKPFYNWIESRFQKMLSRKASLDEILRTASKAEIHQSILACYSVTGEKNVPFLFDGVGRSYPHSKACYYMFSWLIRDAPQQRLSPLIQRISKTSKKNKTEVEADALTELFFKYRDNVKTFEWKAIREVLIDRLEGSRRSIKGHEKETIVRTAILVSLQTFFEKNGNYGMYSRVELIDKQVMIGNETYDVSVNLIDGDGQATQRILIPIKTRETEGGGHAHLFTRDIKSAMNTAKFDNANDFLIVVIVAKNWSEREKENIRNMVDHAAIFDLSPNEFTEFGDEEQSNLDMFISLLLNGKIIPKPLPEREG
ncbi:MAG: hypothetical protein MHPDNHAH_00032 [Anaerolineales bacterium]|nr:hypothetical protein [Anaerolineales bacterium]